ncbi:MAG TPA: DegV family protein, partial [Methanomassiliicoccales archaeon]|nr:DegV family protein [Methanomassiliicoccales archaeon]
MELLSCYGPLERGDIPYLLRMTRENMSQVILSAWGMEWRDETLLETLLDQGLVTEVLKDDDKIVGYYCLDRRGDYLFVVSIQVVRDLQRTGVGRSMMERIEELAGRLKVFISLRSLDFARRGGRVGIATSLVSKLFGIKPVISFDGQGAAVAVAKAFGESGVHSR